MYIGLHELHGYQEKFLKDMNVDYSVQAEAFISDDEINSLMRCFDHILVHLNIDVLDASSSHSSYLANKDLGGDRSSRGRMTIEKCACVLKGITENADAVGLTIAEYLPFDEHKLRNLFEGINIFNG